MNENSTLIGTIQLDTNILTISAGMGITAIALKLVSGTVTYKGGLSISADDGTFLTSEPQTLDSEGFQASAQYPIDNFTIDATSGSCIIILS